MQNLRFSDLEGLRIASEMERRGGEFYRHAARVSKNPDAVTLLSRLAEDETIHEQEFKRLAEQLLKNKDAQEEDPYYSEEVSAYLSAVAAEVVFKGGLMDLVKDQGLDSPEAILKSAIRSEKDSVLFYSEMVLQARSESTRQVFQEIVRQEKFHLNKLQRMLMDMAEE